MVDESSDVSGKEQMAVVLRYVDKLGIIKERLIGLVHVNETSAPCLNSFDSFKVESLMELAKAYPDDFNPKGLK
jgi:hypothetical protein